MKKTSQLLTICMLVVFSLVMTGTALAKPDASKGKGNAAKNGATVTESSSAVVDGQQPASDGTTGAKGKAQEFRNKIKVKGNEVNFDIPPVIKDGRTLIPVRGLMNSLGAELVWDEAAQTVTVTKDDKVVVLTLGSDKVLVDGQETTIDAPAQLMSNRTMVPLRFLAETFGKIVKYDEITGEIDIDDQVTPAEDQETTEPTGTSTDTTATQEQTTATSETVTADI